MAFREAAAVVLTRSRPALEVYWVLRGDRVGFMPGFHAFPGGTTLTGDAEVPIAGAGAEDGVLRAAAIREAFEETGVLLGLETPAGAAERARARERLLAGMDFAALAREHGWRFRADALDFAGRWRTPPFSTARFDTTYFLATLPEGQEPSVVPGELAAGEWIAPERAIERWRDGAATFAAPILHTLEELSAGAQGLAQRLATLPDRIGQPPRRIELKWGIVLHPMKTRPLPPATHTNAYLVGEREVALIDPGSGDPEELRRLFELVDALAADGRTLAQVLLTHAHPDHVGGLAAVRERYRVPVAAHPETASRVPVDRLIADGDTTVLAPGARRWDLRAIHTPGHARGHLCFVHEPTRSLFTGDHVVGGGGTVIVDPPEGDMADYIASLERLLAEPADTLFPAHGSPQGAAPRRIRALLRHRLEREAKVAAALEAKALPVGTLVERAYADTPRELWPYAERSLLAHLEKLEREHRAARIGERWQRAGS